VSRLFFFFSNPGFQDGQRRLFWWEVEDYVAREGAAQGHLKSIILYCLKLQFPKRNGLSSKS
jgi:hypothetical protein